jgi:hypothetical protein
MSSDLYVYGAFLFPKDARAAWLIATLPETEEDEEADEMGVTFQGKSDYQTVKDAIENAEEADRFLDFIEEGEDKFLIRGVLSDDSWYPWTTTLGAMARAAANLGAKGHIEVLDDGSFIGRLSIKDKKVKFDGKAKQSDRAGEKDTFQRLDALIQKEAATHAKKPKAKTAVKKQAKPAKKR